MLGEYLGAGSSITKGLYHLNGDTNDSSGNGYNGTPTNITYAQGKVGNGSASFNGSNSKINYSNNINVGNETTISCWFKYANNASSKTLVSINERTGSPIDEILLYTTNNAIALEYANSAGVDVGVNASFVYDNLWTKVVLVLSSNIASIYINGIFMKSGSIISKSISRPLTIGYFLTSGEGFFTGANIDEVIIENRGWSYSYISQNYTDSLGWF